jgi:two-component system sensor histidine kinase KdpD
MLQVYLGIAPGAGKTYAMLAKGKRLADTGADVVVGVIETHGRADTEEMLRELELVPLRQVSYRDRTFGELDVDTLLARGPSVVLVDELAHSCVPGSRHDKRWEDVTELLDAGIDVITSLNVQHVDSLNDAVEMITGVAQRETVPDVVVASADRVEFVDIPPEGLRARIATAKVMAPDTTEVALAGFFSEDRLAGMRELAVSWLQDHGLLEAGSPATFGGRVDAGSAPGRVVVAMTGAPEGEHVMRRASQIAGSVHAELIGVHVHEPGDPVKPEPAWLAGQRRSLVELGGRYAELAGIDVATTVLDFARTEGARQLVLGATRRSRVQELLHGSVINKAIRTAGPIEVHVIPASGAPRQLKPVTRARRFPRRGALPAQRRLAAWVLALVAPALIALGLIPLRSSLGLAGALLSSLVAVVGVALLGGISPALLATAVGFVLSDFYYTPPLHSLRVGHLVDLVGLITFAVVAAVVGGLIDLLTHQGVQVARSNAEAENLARLAAESMVARTDLTTAMRSIRRTFDLDGAAFFRGDDTRWQVEATVGDAQLGRPDEAPYSVEITRGRVLALAGTRITDQDARLLRVFLDTLRLARGRAVLEDLRDGKGPTG